MEKNQSAPPLPKAETKKPEAHHHHGHGGCCGHHHHHHHHHNQEGDEVDDVIGNDKISSRTSKIEDVKIEEQDDEDDDYVEPIDIWAEKIDPTPEHHRPIDSYSWDQNKKYVSIYVPYNNIGSMVENKEATVQTQFCIKSFRMTITEKKNAGTPSTMKLPSLCFGIHKHKCKIKIKDDMVVVKLKKSCSTEHWTDLQDFKKKKERARRSRMQTKMKDANTWDMLQDLYKDSDDETRKKLTEALYKGREKREGRT